MVGEVFLYIHQIVTNIKGYFTNDNGSGVNIATSILIPIEIRTNVIASSSVSFFLRILQIIATTSKMKKNTEFNGNGMNIEITKVITSTITMTINTSLYHCLPNTTNE
jgi:hypothetical protein